MAAAKNGKKRYARERYGWMLKVYVHIFVFYSEGWRKEQQEEEQSTHTHSRARPRTGKISPFERLHFGGDVTIWSFIDFRRLISLRNDLRKSRRDTIARLDCRNFSMFRIFLSFFASHSPEILVEIHT